MNGTSYLFDFFFADFVDFAGFAARAGLLDFFGWAALGVGFFAGFAGFPFLTALPFAACPFLSLAGGAAAFGAGRGGAGSRDALAAIGL